MLQQLLGCLHIRLELDHQIVGFFPLCVQAGFRRLQVRLCLLGLRLQLLLIVLFGFDSGPEPAQAVQHLLVVVHDLLHIGQTAEQVGKAVRLEQHGPVGGGAGLLHDPGPLAEQRVLLRLLLLVLHQLLGDLGQHLLVACDEGLGAGNLPFCGGDLLVQLCPLFNRAVDVVFQLGNLVFHILTLISRLFFFIFQLVNIALGNGLSRTGQAHRQFRREQ